MRPVAASSDARLGAKCVVEWGWTTIGEWILGSRSSSVFGGERSWGLISRTDIGVTVSRVSTEWSGGRVAVASWSRSFSVMGVDGRNEVSRIHTDSDNAASAVVWSRDGRHIVLGQDGGRVAMMRVGTWDATSQVEKTRTCSTIYDGEMLLMKEE